MIALKSNHKPEWWYMIFPCVCVRERVSVCTLLLSYKVDISHICDVNKTRDPAASADLVETDATLTTRRRGPSVVGPALTHRPMTVIHTQSSSRILKPQMLTLSGKKISLKGTLWNCKYKDPNT